MSRHHAIRLRALANVIAEEGAHGLHLPPEETRQLTEMLEHIAIDIEADDTQRPVRNLAKWSARVSARLLAGGAP